MPFINKIVATLATIAIGAGSLLGIHSTPDQSNNLGAIIPSVVAVFETSLASSIGPNDTTMTLVSATTKDGTTLASSTYGFVLDEGTASEEFVIANCTATACTSMTRGVSAVTGTSSVSTLKKSHRRGASVKMTDAPLLLILSRVLNGSETIENSLSYSGSFTVSSTSNSLVYGSWVNSNYVNKAFNETITGQKTFTQEIIVSSPTGSTSAATKGYVDGVAFAGSPNASSTQKGLVQEATAAQVAAASSTGSTGARLYINPSTFTSIGGLYATSTEFASTSLSVGTTSIATITSTSSTQRVFVFAKGFSDTHITANWRLSYATASGTTTLDTSTTKAAFGDLPGFSLMSTFTPAATGTLYFFGEGSSSYTRAIIQIFR